ncbi:DUF2589 domain-containing protein [Sphingomonas sp. RP10(2022)]|uniref:DUF2589 domain-containing protein n=1 Tax=Sphingomonas liriopis TaxID=2949094 RepID=A0A9X2HX36_9SPHN|nr:DUF2589 domain-containing protein [Sphingomonas liriopis]MCP3735168.1 DUF2589 domain-containing protein [Sphingomonas liriopis]
MTGKIGLHDLVGSVASAIVEAQGMVENAFLALVRRRFDADGRPYGLHIRMPRGPGAVPDHEDMSVPLLALVESRLLAIDSMRIDLDVELGGLDDLHAPADPLTLHIGAPIDVPAIPSLDHPAAARAPTAAAAPAADGDPKRALSVGVGNRTDPAGPTARLSIKVKASPPSETLLRLLTQLNKLTTPGVPVVADPTSQGD